MSFSAPTAPPPIWAEEVWITAFNELSQQIRQHFVRPEPHRRALAYIQGLMSTASRKNGWQVAEEVGETTPYALQHLLDRAKWDCNGVRDELRAYVREVFSSPDAILVIDETGFLKKGCKSVGVQRQYSGTAGRIENCQIDVFLAYASSCGHTLVDRELYLPKSWTDDQKRRREAHVPDEVTFATKPELAQRMLARADLANFPVAWVVGDTVYGSSQPLRAALEERRQAYALAVACKEQVEVQGVRKRVDQFAQALAREDWQVLSAGAGSKGSRLFAWARIELAAPEIRGWQHWLLIRRSLDEGADPADMAYVLVFAPTDTSLENMVEAFGARVQTEIHHPTESGLLVDSCRVLSRLVQRAKELIKDQVSQVEQVCRSRLRTARHTAQILHRQLRRKGEDKEAEQKKLYEKLVETTEAMVRQASRVVEELGKRGEQEAKRLLQEAETMLPLMKRVIAQTCSRVLEGKKVASEQKVLSLFEPYTRAIPRHKGGALVEFGRQVILDEVEGGIVTRYEILAHPNEHGQAIDAVEHHVALFARPPNLVTGDRGVHSAETESRLMQLGVKHVAIPASGPLSQERRDREHSRLFRRGYRWRAGIEGRVASLRRDYGWRKCRYCKQDGMERWFGLGVLASNLRHIAQVKAQKCPTRQVA